MRTMSQQTILKDENYFKSINFCLKGKITNKFTGGTQQLF